MNRLIKKIYVRFKGLLDWPEESLSHNVYFEKTVKCPPCLNNLFSFVEGVYSKFTCLIRQVIQNKLVRLAASVSILALVILVIYSAFVLACAIDDACAAVHMGG